MRKFFAALLAIAMIFTLCACGKDNGEETVRDCGVFITVEADDVFAISCGTVEGSESFQNADESLLEVGSIAQFDFAGEAAEGTEEAYIDYSICAYDKNLEIIAENSFSDDFSNMAKFELVITEDHHILYNGQEFSCGGDTVISYSASAPAADISIMVPEVLMPTRPDAAEKINSAMGVYNSTFSGEQYEANKAAYGADAEPNAQLEAFSMNRTVRVMRGDSAVLSFRMADRANLGTKTTLSIVTHNFDPQTGEELKLADIAKNSAKLTDFCAERVLVATTEEERFLTESMIFVDGYTDNIRNLISDGHWYFDSKGLVIAANPGDISSDFYEFTIPYDDLKDMIKENYLPAELKGSYGNASLQLAKNMSVDSLNLIAYEPDETINSMILTAAGNIYNVNVYSGIYNTNTSSFSPDRQVLFCSDMMRGAALPINRAPAEGAPDLMVSFTCPDGTARRLLVSLDTTNGGLLVMDLDGGSEGIPVSGSVKYDLNGDNTEETLKVVKGDTVSVAVGKETAATEIKSDEAVRLYDLNGDGKMEIYVSGTLESGETVTYCYGYDGKLSLIGERLNGVVSEFNGNRLFVLSQMNVLGTHTANFAYFFDIANNKLVPMQGFEYIFDGDQVITAAVPMALKDGTTIPADTKLHLKSTDGATYVKVTSDTGANGVLLIGRDDINGWTINGQPASVCFKDIT